MRKRLMRYVIAACWLLAGSVQCQAGVVSFGSFTGDFVTVGDPGNTVDDTGYGAVAETFQIMKFEWTNQQYVQFLNTVDPNGTNPNSIYNENMESNIRGGISFASGNAVGNKYVSKTNMGNKPVNYVSWFDAARVSNWLHNGATGSSSTETGAYTLSGATSGNAVTKNSGARYYIPTENEWYKAAYYKGGDTSAGYWDYATQSDSAPTSVTANAVGDGSAGSSGNFANYKFAVWNGVVNMTTVGTNGGPSAYGAFDMGGNVNEWNDTGDTGLTRGIRGGAYNSNAIELSSSNRYTNGTNIEDNSNGFRVASLSSSAPPAVPEPSMMVIGTLFGLGGLVAKRRMKK